MDFTYYVTTILSAKKLIMKVFTSYSLNSNAGGIAFGPPYHFFGLN